MTDARPANCRFRLQDEGKPYPRSWCAACGKGILTGLGRECSRAKEKTDERAPTDAQVMAHPKVKALVEATKEYRSSIAAFDGSGRLDEKSNRLHAANMSLDAALRDLEAGNG